MWIHRRFFTYKQKKFKPFCWDRIGLSYHFIHTATGHLNLVSSKQVNITALDKLGTYRVLTTYYRDLRERS